MDKLLKGIAEPIRLKAAFLLTFGELCICDLFSILELPQTTMSRHMQYMRKCGWVTSSKRGKWVFYKLAPATSEFHKNLIYAIANSLGKDEEYSELVKKIQKHQIGKNCCIRFLEKKDNSVES